MEQRATSRPWNNDPDLALLIQQVRMTSIRERTMRRRREGQAVSRFLVGIRELKNMAPKQENPASSRYIRGPPPYGVARFAQNS